MNRIVYLLMMTLVVCGCGGKETIASKSAAAFRDAQKGGSTLGSAEHGHGAVTPSDSTDLVDHAAMGHTSTAPTDHAAMGRAAPTGGAMEGMDHSRMGQATPGTQPPGSPHAGHATPPQTGQAQTAFHDGHAMPPQPAPTQTGAHAGHAMPVQQDATTVPVGSQVAQAEPGQPSATLAPDSLDSPVATSLMDSARSAEMARQMASEGHAMHGGTNYRQVDAGRVSGPGTQDAATPGSTSSQQQHQHVPPPSKENP